MTRANSFWVILMVLISCLLTVLECHEASGFLSGGKPRPQRKMLFGTLSKSDLKLGETVTLKVAGGRPPYRVSGSCPGAKPSENDQCMRIERLGDDTFRVTPQKLFSPAETSSFTIALQDADSITGTVLFPVANPNWKPPVPIRYVYLNYPDFRGMTRSDVASLVAREGLTNVTYKEATPEMFSQVGKVLNQDPLPGMKTFLREEPPGEDPGARRKDLLARPLVLTIGAKGSFVPDMLLKAEAEAVGLVKGAGFVPQVTYYPETITAMVGKVKNSEPLPYRPLPVGSPVKLLVGRASFDMPNLIGMPQSHATQAVEQISAVKGLRLKPTVVTRETRNIADDGKVFEQTPQAGAALAPGMSVTLNVWRWVYAMPNFIGMTDREAFAVLNQINALRPGFIKLSATQTRDATREADNDRIHEQSPKAGTIVLPGSTAFFQTYRAKPIPNRPNVTPGRR